MSEPRTDTAHSALTDDVVARINPQVCPRHRELLVSLVRHLHDFARDVGLTHKEWGEGIGFLTRVGQACSKDRQEFILLSDILGFSTLVNSLAHDEPGATTSAVLGPFYDGKQSLRSNGASILKRSEAAPPVAVEGRVLDLGGLPIPGASIEIWQAATNGLYDVQDPEQPRGHLRATLVSESDGSYAFHTVLPPSYPVPDDGPVGDLLRMMQRHAWRPAHIHFLIEAAGHGQLVTQIFIDGDQHLSSDAVFGVATGLIAKPRDTGTGLEIHYDFVMGAGRIHDGHPADPEGPIDP